MLRPGGAVLGSGGSDWKRSRGWLLPLLLLAALSLPLSLLLFPHLTAQLQASLLSPFSPSPLLYQGPPAPPSDPNLSSNPQQRGYMVPITILKEGEGPYSDGVCLDGSPPAYHFSPGRGPGAARWLIHMQSGAWCADVADCQARAGTELGSSHHMPPSMAFSGMLSNDSDDNPAFYNWNRAYVRYCDGASLAGTRGHLKEHGLHLAGQKVFLRVLAHLTAYHGLASATHALLSGHSAGGLAAMLHCDQFADVMRALRASLADSNTSLANPSASLAPAPASSKPAAPDFYEAVDTDARGVPLPGGEAGGEAGGQGEGGEGLVVKCLSDAGFFPQERDVAGGSTIGDMFSGTVALHRPATVAACEAARARLEENKGNNSNSRDNSTNSNDGTDSNDSDSNSSVSTDDLSLDSWCFFPRNFLPHIRTPVFVLNSLYDSWMIRACLIPEASANASWRACRDRTLACTAAQLDVLKQYGLNLVKKVREGLYGPPGVHRPAAAGVPEVGGRNASASGACLFSCNFHSAGLWTNRWHGPKVQGRTFAEIVGSWFEGEKADNFYVDCQGRLPPCNPSCS